MLVTVGAPELPSVPCAKSAKLRWLIRTASAGLFSAAAALAQLIIRMPQSNQPVIGLTTLGYRIVDRLRKTAAVVAHFYSEVSAGAITI